jgi:predicted metal-binding protein
MIFSTIAVCFLALNSATASLARRGKGSKGKKYFQVETFSAAQFNGTQKTISIGIAVESGTTLCENTSMNFKSCTWSGGSSLQKICFHDDYNCMGEYQCFEAGDSFPSNFNNPRYSVSVTVANGKGRDNKGTDEFKVMAHSETPFWGNRKTISFNLENAESGTTLCENTSMNFKSCTWNGGSPLQKICFHDDYNCVGEQRCFDSDDTFPTEFDSPRYSVSITVANGKGKSNSNSKEFKVMAHSETPFWGNRNTISFNLENVESGATLCENTSMNFKSCTWNGGSALQKICFHDGYNCVGKKYQCFDADDTFPTDFNPPRYSVSVTVANGKGTTLSDPNEFKVVTHSEYPFWGDRRTISFNLKDAVSGTTLCENATKKFRSSTWNNGSKLKSICFYSDYDCSGRSQCYKPGSSFPSKFDKSRYSVSVTIL